MVKISVSPTKQSRHLPNTENRIVDPEICALLVAFGARILLLPIGLPKFKVSQGDNSVSHLSQNNRQRERCWYACQ